MDDFVVTGLLVFADVMKGRGNTDQEIIEKCQRTINRWSGIMTPPSVKPVNQKPWFIQRNWNE